MEKNQLDDFIERITNTVNGCSEEVKTISKKLGNTKSTDSLSPSVFSFLRDVLINNKNSNFESLLEAYMLENDINENNIKEQMKVKNLEDFKEKVKKNFDDIFVNNKSINRFTFNPAIYGVANNINNRMNSKYYLFELLQTINDNRETLGLDIIDKNNNEILKSYQIGTNVSLSVNGLDNKYSFDSIIEKIKTFFKFSVEYTDVESIKIEKKTISIPNQYKNFTAENQGPLLYISQALYALTNSQINIEKDIKNIENDPYISEFKNTISTLSSTNKKELITDIEDVSSLIIALNLSIVLLKPEETKQLIKLYEYSIANKLVKITKLLEKNNINEIDSNISYIIAKTVDSLSNQLFSTFGIDKEHCKKQYENIGTINPYSSIDFALELSQYQISQKHIKSISHLNINYDNIVSNDSYVNYRNDYKKQIDDLIKNLPSKDEYKANEEELKKIDSLIKKIQLLESSLKNTTQIKSEDCKRMFSRYAFAEIMLETMNQIKIDFTNENEDIVNDEDKHIIEAIKPENEEDSNVINEAETNVNNEIKEPVAEQTKEQVNEDVVEKVEEQQEQNDNKETPIDEEKMEDVSIEENNNKQTDIQKQVVGNEEINAKTNESNEAQLKNEIEKLKLLQEEMEKKIKGYETEIAQQNEQIKELTKDKQYIDFDTKDIIKPKFMKILNDSLNKASDELKESLLEDERLKQLITIFNNKLKNYSDLEMLIGHGPYAMMTKLENGLKNLFENMYVEISQPLIQSILQSKTDNKNINMKNLINIVMCQTNPKIITDIEECCNKNIIQALGGSSTYKIEKNDILNDDKKELMTFVKSNLFILIMKNTILEELIKIGNCKKCEDYSFSSKTIEDIYSVDMIKQIYNSNNKSNNSNPNEENVAQ